MPALGGRVFGNRHKSQSLQISRLLAQLHKYAFDDRMRNKIIVKTADAMYDVRGHNVGPDALNLLPHQRVLSSQYRDHTKH